jgi:ATP phosphoribosyltransferase
MTTKGTNTAPKPGPQAREAERPLRVALPSKGRLSERALQLFEQAGLRPAFAADRALVASLGEGFEAIFVRAQDVPEYVADSAAEIGVTGADCVAESGREVVELLDLAFGRCRLIVATRDESLVRSASELPAGTRVATSFPRSTARYFESLGIPITIAPVSGATEIAPHLGVADAIVDLTSTGSTLRVNGLREIGTVLDSSARLIANAEALSNPAKHTIVRDLASAVESVIRAEQKRYLMANVPRDKLARVREVIPGLSGPTIVEVLDSGAWVAAHAVVDAGQVYQTIAKLKALGAEGILVTRIERLMP